MTPGFGSGSPRKKSKTINDVLFQKELKIVHSLVEAGDFESAESCLRQLLQKVPRHEGALFELTQLWNRQQSYQQTISLLTSMNPSEKLSSALTFNLASAFDSVGFLPDAISAYKRVLAVEPDNHSVLCNLSNTYRKNKQFDQAIECIERAIRLQPQQAFYPYNMAIIYMDSERWSEAHDALKIAINLNPDNVSMRHNNAMVLYCLGQLSDALVEVDLVLNLQGDHIDALITKALVLFALGRRKDSLNCIQQAWASGCRTLPVYNNLAIHAVLDRRLGDAQDLYRQALELWPEDSALKTDLGTVLLSSGEYLEGWPLYEYRHRTRRKGVMPHLNPDLPRWANDSLEGMDRLLVVSEQGLGDTLQFIRYVKYLKDRGVFCECVVQPPLVSLLQQSDVADHVHSLDAFELNPDLQCWMPLMSLPGLLDVQLDDVKQTAPYLKLETGLVNSWAETLNSPSKPSKRIALNWTGNVSIENTFLKGRSFPLSLLQPLIEGSPRSYEFVSLQKGTGSEQLGSLFESAPETRDRFTTHQQLVDQALGFDQTAAVLLNTDLLITNDTAIAHLAGALGHPTWLLLKWSPDWRWGLDGNTTIWYPSLRLFRQHVDGDWSGVVADVIDALST